MKKILKSWRWSQLTHPSGLKRIQNPDWLLGILVTFLLYSIGIGFSAPLRQIFFIMAGILGLISICKLLINICTADDYFELRSEDKKNVYYVYIYETGMLNMHMVVLNSNREEWIAGIMTGDYEVFPQGLIYRHSFEDAYWFYLSVDKDYSEPLGYKFGTNMFIQTPHQNNTPHNKIQVIDGNVIKTIEAEHFIMNNVYLPQKTDIYIDASAWEETPENISNSAPDTKEPTDCFISKQNGVYTVWGIFKSANEKLFCKQISVPAIMFEESGNTVILKRENAQYTEIFRCPSHSTQIKGIVIEKDDKYFLGGTVWKLTENLELEKLYKGEIIVIDNDNQTILGENGFTYTA